MLSVIRQETSLFEGRGRRSNPTTGILLLVVRAANQRRVRACVFGSWSCVFKAASPPV